VRVSVFGARGMRVGADADARTAGRSSGVAAALCHVFSAPCWPQQRCSRSALSRMFCAMTCMFCAMTCMFCAMCHVCHACSAPWKLILVGRFFAWRCGGHPDVPRPTFERRAKTDFQTTCQDRLSNDVPRPTFRTTCQDRLFERRAKTDFSNDVPRPTFQTNQTGGHGNGL